MHTDEKKLKRHIISMRISSEEFDSLHEVMKGMRLRRVSDVMREAIRLVMTVSDPTATEGQTRVG